MKVATNLGDKLAGLNVKPVPSQRRVFKLELSPLTEKDLVARWADATARRKLTR